MADISKILLAAGPEASFDSPSVRRIVELAGRSRFAVDLLGAVHEPHLEGYLGHAEIYESLRRRLVEQRRERLETLAEHFRSQGLACSSRALWGRPEEAIPARALDVGADLVVIDGGGRRAEPSHADWQTIARCPAPVLVARSDGTSPWRTIAAAVDPYRTHGKPRDLDIEILRVAKAVQRLTSARLSVVHCFTPVSLFAPDPSVDGATLDAAEQAVEGARRDALAALVERAGLPSDSAVLARGKPAGVLLDMAAGGEADLLVLGTVSRGRFHDRVIGSTAERVLRRGRGDVLLAPPPRS